MCIATCNCSAIIHIFSYIVAIIICTIIIYDFKRKTEKDDNYSETCILVYNILTTVIYCLPDEVKKVETACVISL